MAHVVLLRGVNVGGHRTFRPKQLAEALAHLDAVNIGAAGTFVIRARVTRRQVEAEVASRLPFVTAMMVFPGTELLRLVERNPFAGETARKDITWFVSVLARKPRSGPRLPHAVTAGGTWQVHLLGRDGRFVYGKYRRHMRAVGYLGEVDKLFGIATTVRNWNTIRTIGRVLEDKRLGD